MNQTAHQSCIKWETRVNDNSKKNWIFSPPIKSLNSEGVNLRNHESQQSQT